MKKQAFVVAILILAGGCGHTGPNGGGYGRAGLSNAKRITPLDYPGGQSVAAASTTTAMDRGNVVARSEVASRDVGTPVAAGAAPAAASAGPVTEIPLYREALQVGKRVVPKGGVVIRKVVETETQRQPVELRSEDIVIERVSAAEAGQLQASGANADGAFQGREVLIQLNREVPVVEKNAVVTEVLRARKVVDTRNETVSGTVRRETIDVDRTVANQGNARSPAGQGSDASEASGGSASFAGSSAGSEQGSAQENGNPAQGTSASATAGQAQGTDRARQNQAELFLHEERLNVGKRVVPSGRVVLRKNVTEEEVSRPVQLREEDIRIEREALPGNEVRGARDNAFAPREIFIPLQEEVPVVEKQVELSEVIRARKAVDTEERVVSGEVRSERAEVGQVREGTGRSEQGN